MKKHMFLICLVTLVLSATIAPAFGAAWPMEPLTPRSEPEILLLIGVLIIFTVKIPRDLVKARADFHVRGWLEKIWSSHAGLLPD